MKFNIPILTRIWEIYKERQQYRKQLQHRLLRRRKKPDEKTLECGHWTDRFLKFCASQNVRLLALLFFSIVLVQKSSAQVVPLQIGDEVPNKVLETTFKLVNHPNGKETIYLKDIKSKLLILDFWATWCSSCIKKIPELEKLKNQFGGSLEILLVNEKSGRDSPEQAAQFLKKVNLTTGKSYQLSSIVGDSVLRDYFPHNSIPHQVWIADGKILAITAAGEVNDTQIQNYLTSGNLNVFTKLNIDKSKPLFSDDILPKENLAFYGILLKGKIDGLGGGSRYKKEGEILVGRSLYNQTLLNMCHIIGQELIKGYSPQHLIINVPEKELLRPADEAAAETWNRENMYSLEAMVPTSQAKLLYPTMLNIINTSSPFLLEQKDSLRTCYALVKKGVDSFKSKGGEPLNSLFDSERPQLVNSPLSYLINRLSSKAFMKYPVLDETGYEGNIDLSFPNDPKTMQELIAVLQKQGLDLITVQRDIPSLYLTLKPNK